MSLRTVKPSRFWSFAIALLMAMQIGLALHTSSHKLSPDAAARGDDCVLCQVASTMAPAPAAPPLAPLSFTYAPIVAQVLPLAIPAVPAAAFRSRAPPAAVSV